jgi:hypothetical protein
MEGEQGNEDHCDIQFSCSLDLAAPQSVANRLDGVFGDIWNSLIDGGLYRVSHQFRLSDHAPSRASLPCSI